MRASADDLEAEKILDSLASHIVIIDGQGIIHFINRAWREFALANGGDPQRTGKGANYLTICEQASYEQPTVETACALAGLRELLAGQRNTFEMEYPCHSAKERRWFLMRCARMTSATPLFTISHINISKQKAFETTLNEERAKYQSMVEALMVGIAIANIDGIIQYVNPAFARLYQYSREELVGMPAAAIVSPAYHSVLKKFFKELPAKGYFEGKTIDVKKDGSPFHTEIRGVYIRYRDEPSCLALVNDISDSIRLEEERKKTAELYTALFEKNQSVILLIDPARRVIIDANPAACRFYGYTRVEFLNLPVSEINSLGDREVNSKIEEAVSSPGVVFTFKHRLADGTLKDVEVYTGPMQVGRDTLLCSIVHDITERKKIEAERETIIADLQKAVAEIRTLQGILPICSFCKKIRDDKGYWQNLEKYIAEHSHARFSHGLCMDCARKYYPDHILPDKG